MLRIETISVADNERVLLFRKNRLQALLTPGDHRFWDWKKELVGVRYDITNPQLNHSLGRFLLSAYGDILGEQVISVDLQQHQVGLVYFDGKLAQVLAPTSFNLYWNIAVKVEVKIIDISEDFQVDKALLSSLARNRQYDASSVCYSEITDSHVGLLKVNGKLERFLDPGHYGFWQFNRRITIEILDRRWQNLEISGQEILTKDRVSLRLNLSASYRIETVEKVATQLKNHAEFLYREFQLALREVVGTRTLDAILADKDVVNRTVEKCVVDKARQYGLAILDVGIKDIILPGEMKAILNQVVEAEKAAEANLIRRREETQATRSLHNTAKLMEGNPTLLRLKELEVLERITGKINQLTVYGGLDGIMKDMVKLTANAE